MSNEMEKYLSSLSEEELNELIRSQKLDVLRQRRNMLLAETDWWVLADRNPTDEQLRYRQALRDITETYQSLDDAVFPEKP